MGKVWGSVTCTTNVRRPPQRKVFVRAAWMVPPSMPYLSGVKLSATEVVVFARAGWPGLLVLSVFFRITVLLAFCAKVTSIGFLASWLG